MTRPSDYFRAAALLIAIAILQRTQLGVSIATIIRHPEVLWRSADYALRLP